MRNMTARAEAKAKGEKQYSTGIPCKKGHLAPRATSTGTCVQCTKEASQAWIKARPGKSAEYAAAYRERNRTAVRERDRILQAKYRAENPEAHRQYRLEYYRKKVALEGREVRSFNRLPVSELVMRLQEVHAGKLQYVSGYTAMTENAVFLCTVHNKEALAHPHNVLRGAIPCSVCNHMRSANENRIAQFLSLFTEVNQRNRELLRPREIDIYLPEVNLAIEYCGDYWHSHGSREEEQRDKHKHYQKYQDCKALGIRLLTIYESEWLTRQYALRRLLRNAVGKTRGRLMARKCELRKVELAAARAFYERYHPQGGDGAGEHYGLFWKGKLVACMRFAFGANDRGNTAKRVWTLTRYATRITVAGAASRLFKAFLAEHQPQEVKSFSDNRYFEGGMYQQLGFVLEEESGPDYQVWSPRLGLRPKAHYQRRLLPQRLKEHGLENVFDPETDPRSEAEMTFLMGCRRLYDCGKKRWIWRG